MPLSVLYRATCLESNALIMPGRVTVQAMLIESYALRQDSMVTSDDNTLGYLIAGFMNDFQVSVLYILSAKGPLWVLKGVGWTDWLSWSLCSSCRKIIYKTDCVE